MDVQNFMDSRSKELTNFNQHYAMLKKEYNSTLTAAIQEQDASKQQELVQKVLDTNTSMVELLRDIIKNMNQGQDSFNPKTLDDLMAELIQYQKEYADIERTKDKVNTLKMILATTSKKLSDATMMYYIYVTILILLCLLVAFFVMKTSWPSTRTIVPTQMPQLPLR